MIVSHYYSDSLNAINAMTMTINNGHYNLDHYHNDYHNHYDYHLMIIIYINYMVIPL